MKKSRVEPNDLQTSHILGVDYGKAKVGLAIADAETKIAFSYGTIKNDNDFYANLLTIIKKENVKTAVIGIPSYINRAEVEYEAEKLGEYLRSIEKLEVFYHNEMFTTKMARERLKERGVKKGLDSMDDREAARIILQSWLDSQ